MINYRNENSVRHETYICAGQFFRIGTGTSGYHFANQDPKRENISLKVNNWNTVDFR